VELTEIVAVLVAHPCRLVEITGGEPLLQEETPVLLTALLERGFEVLLETNGTYSVEDVDRRCGKIIDIKCPSSGEAHKTFWGNMDMLTPGDEIKFVIQDRGDYDYALGVLARRKNILNSGCAILFSPVFGVLPPAMLAKWILAADLPVRMKVQMHRVIWTDRTTGV
jgi:7-carboxy-7-deazaguanine synthase